jgi:hypothetical protein
LEINVALTPIKFGGREGCKWMNDRFQLSWQKIANLYGKTPPRSITSKRKKCHSKKAWWRFHHRHYMGKIEAVAFVSFELTSKLFASEWIQIANSLNAKGTSS